ncbi:Tetratricopeptide-like helical [Metarhizium rileyi]|uniref:Tetratricopeptide-like helical n=1 Tax=Metarhizium rileyi (strain RCEF 4871) TaxID=1649241 RepID=A0A167GTK0_METRR|nr:Tetratricopeptide-like helical [Metarhizium rileyi RCEF 4871]
MSPSLDQVSHENATIKVRPPPKPEDYRVAIIAPSEIESIAVIRLLDRKHEGRLPVTRGSGYVFTLGEMCGHNVIIATLPAGHEYGVGSAAALASHIVTSFPDLWFGLLVEVAAGMPKLQGDDPRDIRLGDVLVALPMGENPGLINLDLGKWTDNGFELRRHGWMDKTYKLVLSAISQIKAEDYVQDKPSFLEHYNELVDNEDDRRIFTKPSPESDVLYQADGSVVERRARGLENHTFVWYGTIGSSSNVIKSASRRDELRDRHHLIGIETQAAGIADNIQVGVICGVADYADGNENENEDENADWKPYAAAMAAAYAKEVILHIGPPAGSQRVISLPHSKNSCFIGRNKIVSDIEYKLFSEGVDRAALFGLGGIGKTQVALDISYRVKEMMEEYSVFWMPGQTMSAFEEAAGDIVETLGISNEPNETPTETLQAYLASDMLGPWLLVVDNVDDMSVVKGTPDHPRGLLGCLPKSPAGRILFTSRTSRVAHSVAQGNNVLELKEMTAEEGRCFLEKSLSGEHDLVRPGAGQDVSSLMERLSYLPLAMQQAVTYMNMNKMTVTQYLRLLGDSERHDNRLVKLLREELRDDTFNSASQGAVAKTWVISFRAIRKVNRHAAQLLSFIRQIDPKAIPRSILPYPTTDLKDEVAQAEAIGLLCSYSFLKWRKDGEMLDMHRLVHLALKICEEDLFEGLMTQNDAIEHLTTVFPSNSWQNRQLWQQYFPHVLPMVTSPVMKQKQSAAAARLGLLVAMCLRDDLRFEEAVTTSELVVYFHSRNTPEDHLDWIVAHHELAFSYIENGQHEEAILILERLVRMDNNPTRVQAQHALMEALHGVGDYERAISLSESSEEQAEKKGVARTHPDRLLNQSFLASNYCRTGRSVKVIKLLRHVAPLDPETTVRLSEPRYIEPSVHLSVLYTAKRWLADAYVAHGQPRKAVRLLQPLASSHRSRLPYGHPKRLDIMCSLAEAYLESRQVQLALGLLRPFVELQLPGLEADDVHLVHLKQCLAKAYLEAGQYEEASKLCKTQKRVPLKDGS